MSEQVSIAFMNFTVTYINIFMKICVYVLNISFDINIIILLECWIDRSHVKKNMEELALALNRP